MPALMMAMACGQLKLIARIVKLSFVFSSRCAGCCDVGELTLAAENSNARTRQGTSGGRRPALFWRRFLTSMASMRESVTNC